MKFNVKSASWEEEKPGGFPPAARSFGAGVNLTSNSFLVFGGTDRGDQLIGGLHLYNKGKWSKVESSSEIVSPRRQAALVAVSDTEILLLGGVDKVDQGTDTIFNPLLTLLRSNRGELCPE